MGMGVDVQELAELGLREAKLIDRYVGLPAFYVDPSELRPPCPECGGYPSHEPGAWCCRECGYVWAEAGPAPRSTPADDEAGGTCG